MHKHTLRHTPPFSQSADTNSKPKITWNNAFSVKPKCKNSQIKIIRFIQNQYVFASNLSSSGHSQVHLTPCQWRAEKGRVIILLPQSPALFRISLSTLLAPKWWYSQLCFRNFQMLIFNKQDEKLNTTTTTTKTLCVLGGSGWVVNSLDFYPALLKSLGCFYFQCILSSQWKAVTVNSQSLQCQL